jgi:hypothetical protein
VLAYLSWHRPAVGADLAELSAYERALAQFHHSLEHMPPSGFRGSATFRTQELPWPLAGQDADQRGWAGYEDWYLLDDWAAVGVLEEAAVSRGHLSAHEKVASLSGGVTGAVYRLVEGHPNLLETRVAVWVTPAPEHADPSFAALLGDGMDPAGGGLWRRSLGLGPAPEYCLLVAEAPAGVAPTRLPKGWSATTISRERLAS